MYLLLTKYFDKIKIDIDINQMYLNNNLRISIV